ncbi:hypothetical protein ABTX34_17105 [Streptomyces sp. NPDC096538]|uniref:hypothetical protein n=1 Tax=Streptomyces sp. NPDC096538 TaxID=3155427 RepID=UPI00333124F4
MAATDKVIPASLACRIAELATGTDVAPLVEARVFRVLTTAGYEQSEIGTMTGHRACYVGWRLDLLKLIAPAQTALENGDLPVNLASWIALLSEPNQTLMLARWLRGDFSGARHAERYARAIAEDETTQF